MIRVLLLTLLCLLLPVQNSMAFDIVDSILGGVKSVYSFTCTFPPLVKRGKQIYTLVNSDFKEIEENIKKHNKDLRAKSDEEFADYMLREVGKAAFCHPIASALSFELLPGRDIMDLATRRTAALSSLDRKTTYATWAYNMLYRSLHDRIELMQSGLSSLPSRPKLPALPGLPTLPDSLPLPQTTSPKEKEELAAAEKMLKELKKNPPSEVLPEVPAPSQAEHPANAEDESSKSGPLLGSKPGSAPLRPTITTYVLQDSDLQIYEVDTLDLLLPSSTGVAQRCYERFRPDYPLFARMVNSGRAKRLTSIPLEAKEQAELLKFFKSAADMRADSFMLADQVAVVLNGDETNHRGLAGCLELTTPASEKASQWPDAQVVTFEQDSKMWQTLMTMLAAKYLVHAQHH